MVGSPGGFIFSLFNNGIHKHIHILHSGGYWYVHYYHHHHNPLSGL